jgi:glutamate formiminotransferase
LQGWWEPKRVDFEKSECAFYEIRKKDFHRARRKLPPDLAAPTRKSRIVKPDAGLNVFGFRNKLAEANIFFKSAHKNLHVLL